MKKLIATLTLVSLCACTGKPDPRSQICEKIVEQVEAASRPLTALDKERVRRACFDDLRTCKTKECRDARLPRIINRLSRQQSGLR